MKTVDIIYIGEETPGSDGICLWVEWEGDYIGYPPGEPVKTPHELAHGRDADDTDGARAALLDRPDFVLAEKPAAKAKAQKPAAEPADVPVD